MKTLKVILAAAITAATASALAVPTLTISDGVTTTTLSNPSGVITFGSSFDAFWNVLIITGETKPALGSSTSPILDLNIQASSTGVGPTNNLVITLSDNNFGPTTGTFVGKLSGSVGGGPGTPVTFSTFYNAANVTSATTTPLTSTGPLAPPNYFPPDQISGPFSQPLYSLTEVVTIGAMANPSGLYNLDATLSLVPEPSTISLLLAGAAAIGAWRRRK